MAEDPIPPDYTKPPPAEFNAEWAKFVLDYKAANKRRPVIENVGTFVAVTSSLIALAVTVYNTVHLTQDRKDQSKKTAMESQVSLAKLYFDKLPNSEFCDGRKDKLLFAKTAVTIAGLSFNQMVAAAQSDPELASFKVDADNHDLQGLALVLFTDIYPQIRGCDDVKLKINAASAVQPSTIQVAAPTAGTTYALREQASAETPKNPSKLTAYIQYKKGDNAALERARTLQSLLASKGIIAPGIEGVPSVPTSDQLRIYKRTDETRAKDLKNDNGFHLGEAQIIDLSTAYPNLPAGIIEIWLGVKPG